MDAVLIIIIALVCSLIIKEDDVCVERNNTIILETKLNPTRYHDEKGFMVVADVIDFR